MTAARRDSEPTPSPRRRIVPRGLRLPLVLIVMWEGWFTVSDSAGTSLAPPSQIAAAFFSLWMDGSMLTATLQTIAATLIGLAIGGTLGIVSGLFLGLSRSFDRLMEVTVEVSRPIPPVALIPIALMIFGFGYRLETSIIAFSVVWPVMILTRSAINSVEPQLKEYASLLRLSLWDKIRKIILPATLPTLFVALRLGASIALILAITVEITINPIGLGSGIMTARMSLNPAYMLAYLVWIGLIGLALNASLLALQRRWFDYTRPRGGAR
ncbi:ABC transporter permease [Pusillimonas caeni]|uniref:ABC transporter permease n=1 Tax=Pusillimonas caeni TaxID=1348472 RepID=UPI000E59D055|nr:ABC transporter permease [Pusillimonas caeni]TFL15636.1 ABC transporter permease [Pusillimonas caeni]